MTIKDLYQSISQIYDSKFAILTNSCKIIEKDKQATRINEFNISSTTEFIEIKGENLGKTKEIFKKIDDDRSFKHNCDWIIITQRKNKFVILLVELKNQFTQKHFSHALSQFIASDIQVRTVLGIIKDFGKCHPQVECLIVSEIKEVTKSINSHLDTVMAKNINLNRNYETYVIDCYNFLLEDHNAIWKKNKCWSFSIPVKPKHSFDTLKIELIEGNNQTKNI